MNDEELKERIVEDLKREDRTMSVTQLQCRYKIGYARIARAVEALVEEGILFEQKRYGIAQTIGEDE